MKQANRLRGALGVAAGALALASGMIPALAHAGGPNYVALGDSIAAGTGSATLPYDLNLTCSRTQGAYPAIWAASHSVGQFTFAACGGAKTTDVIASQLGALDANTALVTVTAGGNDASGVQTVLACSPTIPIVQTTESAACTSALATYNAFVQTQLPTLLSNMFQAIRQAAPNARIVFVGYPGIFQDPGSDAACNVVLETAEVIPVQQARADINAAGQTMRSVIIAAAQANGVLFADPMPFFAGHRVCTSAPPPWLNTVVPGGATAYHPTTSGYADGYVPALNQVTATLGF
jgi:lysophospholipase L1-like esterase